MSCTYKKTILFFFLAFGICVDAFTQDSIQTKKTKLSISAGYGYLSMTAIGESEQRFHEKFLEFGPGLYYSKFRSSGAFVLGVKFSSKRWKYGLDMVYENFLKDVQDVHLDPIIKDLGNSKVNYWGLVPRVDYYWLNKRIIRAYSGIGVGFGYQSEKYDFADLSAVWRRVSINIIPVGFEAGNTVCVYGESSLGVNGLVCGGIRIRL